MRADRRGPGIWLLRIAILASTLLGIANVAGGAWLVALGGSVYYPLAGVAMLATAWLLVRRHPLALYPHAALTLATLVWAVAEIGFDWWQLVPRGDLIFLLGALLLLPAITRRLSPASWAVTAGPLAGVLGLAVLVAGVSAFTRAHDMAGTLPGERVRLAANHAGVPDGDWTAYGRSWRGDKWSPLRQITPANVGRLEVAWSIRTGDMKRPTDPDETTYEVTPLKIGDTVYLCTPHDMVLALDAETGRTRWHFDPKMVLPPNLQHLTCRGVSYHADAAATGDCARRILLATADARLIALDAATGRRCAGFGRDGEVSLRPGQMTDHPGWYQFTSAPLVARDRVVLAGAVYDNAATRMPSGVIRAFDVTTGRLLWNFDPGHPGDTAPLAPGRHYTPSSPNSWSTAAADDALGLIYLPMGMGAIDQWGGRRPATTERFATSVLALDTATGRPRWVFQTVHHDLWEMDVPAQPVLVDLDLAGRGRVPALVQATKTGNIFVLDRRTGRPLLPVTERPVPGSPAPGDRLSPTQPQSALSLAPSRLFEQDMWGATMLDQLACRIAFRRLRYDGPFTPPSLQGSLVYPGNFGVTDWGGLAVDPERQVAFVNPSAMAFVDRLIPRHRAGERPGQGPAGSSDLHGSTEHGYNPNAGAPFAVSLDPFLSPLGLPCQAPPWGYVAGLDLVTGKVAYRHPNGTVRDETPLPLPFRMGVPSLGGPMMTAGGVAFLSAAIDDYVRAYDVTSGRVLWRARLPAGGQATPMSYWSGKSGRQFVLVVAGGHAGLSTRLGDHVIAYALPPTR